MMKKVIKISLILAVALCMAVNTYAASCTMNVEPVTKNVETGKEFTVNFIISNIDDDKGMLTFTARLEYDTGLTFKEIKGMNGWNPEYNAENGKMAAERSGGFAKETETVFQVTFIANGPVNSTPKITLTDIIFSNGTDDIDVIADTDTVTIVNSTIPDGSQGGNQGGDQSGNQGGNQSGNQNGTQDGNQDNNQGNNAGTNQSGSQGNNQNTNNIVIGNGTGTTTTTNTVGDLSVKDEKLPQTGDMDILLIGLTGALVLGIGFFVKIKLIDHKLKN